MTIGLRSALYYGFGLTITKKDNFTRLITPRSPEAWAFLSVVCDLKSLGLEVQTSSDCVRICYPDGDKATCEQDDHPELLNTIFLVYKYGGKIVDGNDSHNTSIPSTDRWFVLTDSPSGRVMVCPGGIKLSTRFLGCPICIVETFLLKIHDVPNLKDKTIIDVGAWIGDTALRFASLKASRIISLEPNAENFRALLRNLELNPSLRSRIEPLNAAFGIDGNVTLGMQHRCGGDSSIFYGDELHSISVPSVSLKTLLKERYIKEPYYLKVDAKGAERALIHGPEFLSMFKFIKIEYATYLGRYKLQSLLNVIRDAGFTFQIFREDPTSTQSSHQQATIMAEKLDQNAFQSSIE